jgi:hypothetical protein
MSQIVYVTRWISSQEIVDIAKGVIPDLKTFSLPQGLQVNKVPIAQYRNLGIYFELLAGT